VESRNGRPRAISISAARLARLLAALAAALVAVNVAILLAWYSGTGWVRPGVLRLFYLDAEQNVPSYFSTLLLFLPAMALGGVAVLKRREGKRFATHWTVLSLTFLFLSMDEAASIHEGAIGPMREVLGPYADGPLWFAWVVPGALACAVFGLSYVRFLWSLPGRTRRGMIASGAVYLLGALGMEMVGASYAFHHGQDNLLFTLISTAEESLEMAGLVWFLYVVLDYVGLVYGAVTLDVASARPATAAAERESPGPDEANAARRRFAERESPPR